MFNILQTVWMHCYYDVGGFLAKEKKLYVWHPDEKRSCCNSFPPYFSSGEETLCRN